MKKNMFIIFIVCSFFMFNLSVKAEIYNCYYNYNISSTSGSESGEIQLIIDTEEKTIKSEGGFLDYDDYLLDRAIDLNWTEKKLIDEYIYKKEKQEYTCPTYIYGCEVHEYRYNSRGDQSGGEISYFPLINPNLIDKIEKGEIYLEEISDVEDIKKGEAGSKYYLNGDKECLGADLNSSKSGKKGEDTGISCEKYDNLKRKLEESYCNTGDCSLSEYHQSRDKIKKYCNIKLKHSVYADPCVKQCLKVSEEIAGIEGTTLPNSECGFSGKLLAWISNILRWIKYIAPVIIIVMGILDFIKAISADKDDEMKKAQGRFVKRLIAAALVFIIPLIIEFVLDKMGFGYDSCGLF